jgi:hypothetical protein
MGSLLFLSDLPTVREPAVGQGNLKFEISDLKSSEAWTFMGSHEAGCHCQTN